jgi:hypothetical protein
MGAQTFTAFQFPILSPVRGVLPPEKGTRGMKSVTCGICYPRQATTAAARSDARGSPMRNDHRFVM